MLNSPSSTRFKILEYLLLKSTIEGQNYGCSVKDIANEIDISLNSVRQYMNELERDQLVIRKDKKGKTGRPAMFYSINENSVNLFPKAYADFSVRLINQLVTIYGSDVVREILTDVGKDWAREMKEAYLIANSEKRTFPSLREKMALLIEIFKEYGKFPELTEEDSKYVLKSFNCLIFDIVRKQPLACIVDKTLVAELAGREIESITCLSKNNLQCTYQIQKDVEIEES